MLKRTGNRRFSMRLRAISLVCSALIVLSVSVVAAQSAPPLAGTWEGTLAEKRATGSRELRQSQSAVFVQISTASDGKYVGVWLSSKRVAEVVKIGEVAIQGDAIRIDVP